MAETKIIVNKKTFILKFGMKVLRLLSEKWNTPGLSGVFAKLTIFEDMTDDVSFEQLDVINDLILASVKANEANTETLSPDELDELFLSDSAAMMKITEQVFKGFMASIPQAKPVGKQKAARNYKAASPNI
jgi:hypothetical protein